MILASLWSRSISTDSNLIGYVKYLCLAVFSPLLIPLLLVFFPFILALQLFLRLVRRRWRRKRRRRAAAAVGRIGNEEFGNGQRLLQRYLDDQLILVLGSLYDQCGDGDDEEEAEEISGADVECFDGQRPFLTLGKH